MHFSMCNNIHKSKRTIEGSIKASRKIPLAALFRARNSKMLVHATYSLIYRLQLFVYYSFV